MDDQAATMKIYWHEQTMRELEEIIPKLETVIIPTGSTEIHGPHLGVGNDILTATRVCEDVARALYPRALVVRALWIGYAPHNMCEPFKGTITLSAETYLQVLYEVAESLHKHDVKRIVLVNGHGGNVEPNLVACRKIREGIFSRYGVDLEVGCLSYWDTIPLEVWKEVLEAGELGIGHGGEAETSILMAVAPQAVRTDYLTAPDERPHGFPRAMKVQRAWYQDEYNPDGHTDDARVASREKGEKLLEAAAKGTIQAIEEFIRYKPIQKHRYPRPAH